MSNLQALNVPCADNSWSDEDDIVLPSEDEEILLEMIFVLL